MKSIKKVFSQPKQQKKIIKSQVMDNQTQCPICLIDYDLVRVVPMMICFNQHSTCAKCLSDIYKRKKCPICCQILINKSNVKKNRLICFMLQEMFKGNGQILLYSNGYTYKGEVKNGKRHGIGEQITRDGTYYKGNFVNGEITGRCQAQTKYGAKFVGQAKEGRIQGAFTTKYGSIVEGTFDMQTLSGPNCKKTYTNGDTYIGTVHKLKANGFGKLTFKNGNSFQGNFSRDYISNENTGVITGTFQVDINNGQSFIKQINDQIQVDSNQSQFNQGDQKQSENHSDEESQYSYSSRYQGSYGQM